MKDEDYSKKEIEEQLLLLKHKIEVLNLIEEKLLQMREIAQYVMDNELRKEEVDNKNQEFKSLEVQLKLLNLENTHLS